MSASRDDIVVRIAGDLSDIQRSLRDLQKRTKETGEQARRSGRDWGALGTSLDSIRNRITGIVGAYLGFQGIRSVTGFIRETASALQDVDRQARALGSTRQSIQELNFTFRAFGLDANDVSDALGTLADRARDAQDGQKSFIDDFRLLGVSVDELRGKRPEELFQLMARRISEIQDPTRRTAGIVRIFGDDLGRRLNPLLLDGEEGLRQFAEAAREAGHVLEDEAVDSLLEVNKTVSDLTAQLRGQGIRTIAEYAEEIRTLADVLAAAAGGTLDLLDNVVELFGGLNNTSLSALRGELRQLEDALESGFFSRFGLFNLGGNFELHISREQIKQEIERVQNEIARIQEEAAKEQETRQRRSQIGVTPFAERRRILSGQEQEPEPLSESQRLRQLQSELAASGVLVKDEIKRLGEELDRELEGNLVRFSDYYRRRAELETRAIDQQIQSQRTALAAAEEQIRLATESGGVDSTEAEERRAKLIAEITVLERQRSDVALRAAHDQAVAERELADQLAAVRERLADLQGDTVTARTSAVEREFRELMGRLVAEGDAEGQELVRRLINVEAARAQLDQLESDYSRALARMSREERRIELAAQTGAITERDARRQIADLYRETAAEVEALIPLMAELSAVTGDPAAIERLEELRLEIEGLRASAEQSSNEMAENIQRAGKDAFADWISGAQSASEAWNSFVDNIRKRAADLLADQVIQGLVSALSGLGGGGGFFKNFGKGFVGASEFHTGGIVGQGGRPRMIPALALAGAPRYHTGGIAGFAPDERLAVLQTGEEVLSRRDPRNRLNGGGGVQNINVNIQTQDAQSFSRASRGQISAQLAAELARAKNRNG